MAVERFVRLHSQFGQFMPSNCTINNSSNSSQEVAELVAAKMELHKLQYHGYETSNELVDFDDFGDSDDRNESCKSCDSWTCTNDFIFAVALVVNLCKFNKYIQCTCILCIN